jgi:glyoxylase-like metal-dependent hydrolase (beta-lactamase superfamily II)
MISTVGLPQDKYRAEFRIESMFPATCKFIRLGRPALFSHIQPLMKITRITAHALQLTRLGLVNCYLVQEHGAEGQPDSFTLIDANLANSEDDILAAAASAGAPIRRILLTHAHVDHVGSVDALVQKLNQQGIVPELAASARSIPLLAQPPDKTLLPGEPHDEIRGGLPGIKSRLTHLLAGGELYGSLRVLETPGHIPGHLSFLDERDGTLFAGDAFGSVGRLSVSGFMPWYFSLPNLGTWNRNVALATARTLLQGTTVPIERFACGHGKVKSGGRATLEQAIAKARQ